MTFQREDRVRLTEDMQALHLGPEIVRKGTTGHLVRMYRHQEGLDIWQMVLDGPGYKFLAVPHTKMEKIGTTSDRQSLVDAFFAAESQVKREEPEEEDDDDKGLDISIPDVEESPSSDKGDSGGGGASDDF